MRSPFRTADFEYSAPRDAIAQRPLADRGGARLLVLDRRTGAVAHRTFREFATLLDPGDLLVLNRSRVVPARLLGRRDNGRPAEVLLIHPEPDGSWLAMVHPGGKLKRGRVVTFGSDGCAHIGDVLGGGLRRVRLSGSLSPAALMERYGQVPLPPYIERAPDAADRDRYQTVFADADGSVAAPTAGLHFTREMLQTLADHGVELATVVLHIGPGTFKPVVADDPAGHRMHAEWFELTAETAAAVNAARRRGRRVWAVGTSVARVLETVGQSERLEPASGWTDLFIRPPYEFRALDALLTNFHLPRSTLLMLVAAFAGYEHTMRAYREAVTEGYRLYSYGDAMAIV